MYFDLNQVPSPASSQHSKSSSDISINRLEVAERDKYASPSIGSEKDEPNNKKLFDYYSSHHSKSYGYSSKDCPATPNKRITRSSKNVDLISPVTRILTLDVRSSQVLPTITL